MIRKLVAIVLAVLINCVMLAWLNTWSTTEAVSALPSRRADKVLVLSTVTVRPTRAQLEMLRHETGPAGTSGTAIPGVI